MIEALIEAGGMLLAWLALLFLLVALGLVVLGCVGKALLDHEWPEDPR